MAPVFTGKEQEDEDDLIERIATQPWCDGNAGMLGRCRWQGPCRPRSEFPVMNLDTICVDFDGALRTVAGTGVGNRPSEVSAIGKFGTFIR